MARLHPAAPRSAAAARDRRSDFALGDAPDRAGRLVIGPVRHPRRSRSAVLGRPARESDGSDSQRPSAIALVAIVARAGSDHDRATTATSSSCPRPPSAGRTWRRSSPAIGERGCWCQYWRQSSGDYSRGGPGSGERDLRAAGRRRRRRRPGVIAYVRWRSPAGWCGFGPRSSHASAWSASADDPARRRGRRCGPSSASRSEVGYRRQPVVTRVACWTARSRTRGRTARRCIEAYPIDPEGQRLDVAFSLRRDSRARFEAAGFTPRSSRPAALTAPGGPRWLMRLDLARGPSARSAAQPCQDPVVDEAVGRETCPLSIDRSPREVGDPAAGLLDDDAAAPPGPRLTGPTSIIASAAPSATSA